MGTRNIIIVKVNNKIKVAQYCQWDGYPTGQGMTIAKFLRSKQRVEKLTKNLASVEFVDDKHVQAKWVEVGANPNSDMVSLEVCNNMKQKYPQFSRDTGATILELIAQGKVKEVRNDISTWKDKETWLEYCYEIDMTKQKVTIRNKNKGKALKILSFDDMTPKAMKLLEKELNAN